LAMRLRSQIPARGESFAAVTEVALVLGPRVPGALESLRNATRSRHASLGASPAMRRLFEATYSLGEYRTHLGRLLGIVEPLERAVVRAAEAGDPLLSLRRTDALREDLRRMGVSAHDVEGLERCRSVPAISPAGLRGYGYVALGSMLGGKIIVKRLRTVLGGKASFRFYGDENGRGEARWASFCTGLEADATADVPAICSTAVAIFDAYGAWLAEPFARDGNR